jgi:hypothetical protein
VILAVSAPASRSAHDASTQALEWFRAAMQRSGRTG